jgi:Phage integrase family
VIVPRPTSDIQFRSRASLPTSWQWTWPRSRDLVFTAPEGGVLRNINFRPRFFDPVAEKVGLPGLTPHELRHTAAGLAVAAGANAKAMQQMLGHASAAMTLDVYAGLFADDLDGVADQLDRAYTRLNADQMRTTRLPSQGQTGRAALREFARTSRWLGQTTESRLGESNPRPTHYESRA